jgi:hypothetical protein
MVTITQRVLLLQFEHTRDYMEESAAAGEGAGAAGFISIGISIFRFVGYISNASGSDGTRD